MPVSYLDMHHHFLPESVMRRLRAEAGDAQRLVNDKISMTLSPMLSDAEAHLECMDAARISRAVLTYSGISVLGTQWCRDLNEGLAELANAHPDRLYGAAHVDLDDPAAPAELKRCASELGFRAVALPCSTPRTVLDAPSLRPLWATISELDLPVILHPALLPGGASTDYSMERSCARPFDTTTAAVRLVCGVLPTFPSLRFVLPHCGGTAAFLKGRLSMFFAAPGQPAAMFPRTRREQHEAGIDAVFDRGWSRLWFDTAGTGGWDPAVVFTASVVGAGRVVFGSDFPLESHSSETLAELAHMVDHLDMTADERDAIAFGTAEALLGLVQGTGCRLP